jgi:hypothetical protein
MASMKKWVNEQQTILEKEMIEHAAKKMQEDIDREILWGMLEGIGWTRVMLPPFQSNTQAINIMLWLETNCKGSYEHHDRDFLFENKKDASHFILRWV